jgi:benzoate/toluate 1,2-dioxygenase alpha subunit
MDGMLPNIDSLIGDNRVHRSVYEDPAIFELEMARIFHRAWVYVGHDSEVPEPGDYVTRRIGRKPVVMSRHDDGEIYVIHNSCGHRGAIVCPLASGHVEHFRCAYHGWTFRTNGEVDGISMPRGYGEAIDLTDPAMGMRRLARVDQYRGFVFASLAEDGPTLEDWLGPARPSIDDVTDRAPSGRISLSAGVHRYVFRGNWKLQLENTVDMYHVPFSHESTLRPDGRQFVRRLGDESGSTIADTGEAASRWEQREAWASGSNGHSFTGHQPVAEGKRDDPVYDEYVALLAALHPPERLAEILSPRRHNTAYYPNMSLQALNQHIRVIIPISVDRTEINVYPVLLDGAPEAMNRDIVNGLNVTHSAASLIQTDDLENFRRCQDGVSADNSDWVWFARGQETDVTDNHGDIVNRGTVESPQRAQYTAWKRLMGEAS